MDRDNHLEAVLEKAASAAVDIVVSEMDCRQSDSDYEARRSYARERLAEFLCRRVQE